MLDNLKNTSSIDDLKHYRRKMSAIIKEYVSKIIIHNIPKEISSEVDLNDIPMPLLKELKSRSKNKYNTVSKMKAVFDTDYGKRKYNETQRNFTVIFHSGKSKTVFPYSAFSIVGDADNFDLDKSDIIYEDESTLLDQYIHGNKTLEELSNNEISEIIKDVEDDFKNNS